MGVSDSVPKEERKFYPIVLKVMTERETREYHMHRLYDLSLKSRAKEMR